MQRCQCLQGSVGVFFCKPTEETAAWEPTHTHTHISKFCEGLFFPIIRNLSMAAQSQEKGICCMISPNCKTLRPTLPQCVWFKTSQTLSESRVAAEPGRGQKQWLQCVCSSSFKPLHRRFSDFRKRKFAKSHFLHNAQIPADENRLDRAETRCAAVANSLCK